MLPFVSVMVFARKNAAFIEPRAGTFAMACLISLAIGLSVPGHAVQASSTVDRGVAALSAVTTMGGTTPVRIMPLGDSITDGHVLVPGGYRIELWRLLAAAGQPIDFVGPFTNGPPELPDRDHAGRSGFKIAQLAFDIDSRMTTYAPDVVLLMAGANDMWHNDDVANAPARLSAMIERIFVHRPQATVIVAATPAWNDSVVTPRIVTYNAALPSVVAAHHALGRSILFVNMFTAVPVTDLHDGIHPNAEGFRKMANVWYGALQLLWNASLPPQVAITSPTAATPLTEPAQLTIVADASDADGVSDVEFFVNGTSLGTDTTLPYTISLPNVAAGTYVLTARARDMRGTTSLSAPVSVTVTVPNGVPRIMPLGDSLTAGEGVPGGYRIELWRQLTVAGQAIDFVGSFANGPASLPDRDHSGVSGIRIAGLASNIDTWMTTHAPDVVLLMAGANDMWQNDDVANAPARLSALIDRIFVHRPQAVVILASTLAFSNPVVEARIVAYNAALPNVVAAHQALGRSIMFVDMHAVVPLTDLYDGVHPTAEGHRKLGLAWYAAVTGVLNGNSPPQVAITSPTAATPLTEPAQLTIVADASDAGGLSDVEFFANGTSLGAVTAPPYTTSWSNVAAGTYVLTARARDLSGATSLSAPVSITVTGPNDPPVVRMTGPLAGSSWQAPATILLAAEATDSTGGIARVEFYAGATLLGQATTAPYSRTWSGVGAGTYQITARAWDTAGASTTSDPIVVTVAPPNQLPTARLTAPAPESRFDPLDTLTLTAEASDPDGAVTRVEFFAGTTLLGEAATAPYSVTWSGVGAGTYQLVARAWDSAGMSVTSATVNVRVGVPRVMPLGDSITDGHAVPGGYRVELWRQMTEAGVPIDFVGSFTNGPASLPDKDHSGISGFKIAQLAFNIDTWMTTHAPDVVLLMAGANDMWHIDDVANAPARLSAMIDRIFAHRPQATVIVAATPAWNDPGVTARIVAYNAALPNVVAAHHALGRSIMFVDMYAVVPITDLHDGVHPSAEGYRKMALVWYGALMGALTGTVPPTVSLTRPGPGVALVGPASVSLEAEVVDPNGVVNGVEFFANGQALGRVDAAPFAMTWSDVSVGTYVITARAHYGDGDSTVSAPVSIGVVPPNQPPTVQLTAPTASQAQSGFDDPATIALTAGATDPDGTISRVEFYAGTTLLGHSTTAPYGFTWRNVAAGSYSLTVAAVDDDGARAVSAPVNTEVRAPVVAIAASDPSAAEVNANPAEFVVSRSGNLQSGLLVRYSVDGTAAPAVDYAALPGVVSIPAGVASARIVLTPQSDLIAEGDETVRITLTPAAGYTVGPLSSAVATIADRPTVTVQASVQTTAEQSSPSPVFTVIRSGATTHPLAVSFAVTGSAGAGVDYKALGSLATIPAGAVSVDLPLVVIDDLLAEQPELVSVKVSPGQAYMVGTAAQATITIADNEPVISLAVQDASAAEPGSDVATLSISRSVASDKAMIVYFSVAGTASHGGDYKAIGSSVTIPALATAAQVIVTPLNDLIAEKPETVVLTLSAHSTYSVSAPNSASVSIADDEPEVALVVTDPAGAEPGTDTASFEMTRTGNLASAATVFFSTSGTATSADYRTLGASAVFAAGSDRVTLLMTPLNDLTAESRETVTVTLSPNSSYTIAPTAATASVTIDDDEPIVTVSAPDPLAQEPGTDTALITVSRNSPGTTAVVVYFRMTGTAGHGTDYRSLGASVTIPAGATSASLVVTPINDNIVEPRETLLIELTTNPAYTRGAVSSVALALDDDEPTVGVTALSPDAVEAGARVATFLVTRTGPTNSALAVSVTLGGTAVNGSDYTFLGATVTIPVGADSAVVTVTPIADVITEAAETVTLTIAARSHYALATSRTATATIRDQP